MVTTKKQRIALKRLYLRGTGIEESYLAFRRRVQQGFDCLMVEWCGMFVGIETDGYTHS